MSELPSNYLLVVEKAVIGSVNAGQNQQLADANLTTQDVNMEQTLYNDYQKKLSDSPPNLENVPTDEYLGYWVEQAAKNLKKHPGSQKYQAELTEAQTKYQVAKTTQETTTNQADSATQAMQTQTGQDSSLMQQKVQLEMAINQIAQALGSLLQAA